jgi:hypothetical protein
MRQKYIIQLKYNTNTNEFVSLLLYMNVKKVQLNSTQTKKIQTSSIYFESLKWYIPPVMKNGKACFFWFFYDRTSFRSHTYTTDRPCVTLSAGKVSAIYIQHWLRKRKINLTHSYAVAINTCNYAYVFDISCLILTW